MKSTLNWSIAIICYAALVSGAAYQVIELQVSQSKDYSRQAAATYLSRQDLPAERGRIFDASDRILADNIPSYNVIVDKYHLNDPRIAAVALAWNKSVKDPGWAGRNEAQRRKLFERNRKRLLAVPEDEEESSNGLAQKTRDDEIIAANLDYTAELISPILKIPREELMARFLDRQKRVILARNISDQQHDELERVIADARLQGISFEKVLKRQYTMPDLAVHVMGYTDFENRGMTGIEKTFDSYLRGQSGFRLFARDTRGLPIPASGAENSLKPPVDGLGVKLTIDMRVQAILEEELDAGLKEYKTTRGAIVLVEPHTGNILGMVSRPTFNLNERQNMDVGSLNFSIQGTYEPGSTLKAVASSAALDTKKATPETSISCEGGRYSVYGTQITDSHPYGSLTLTMCVAKSSNIAAYKMGAMVGAQKFGEYLSGYGFGKKTGIDLPNENSGNVRPVSNPVDFSRLTYGYAMNATPLQICMLYAAIANDGKLMRPRLVDTITDRTGAIVERPAPVTVKQVIKPATAKAMHKILATVTEKGGTATQAQVPGYSVGGKTGTARRYAQYDPKTRKGGGYVAGEYTVSFVGMMPASKPAFVALVVIDNPKSSKVTLYGGTIAAPIFARLAPRVAAVLNIVPDRPEQLLKNAEGAGEGDKTKSGDKVAQGDNTRGSAEKSSGTRNRR